MKIKPKEIIEKYLGQIMNTKTLIIIFIIGIVLLTIPVHKNTTPKNDEKQSEISEQEMEVKLEEILSEIKGAGKVEVMITLSDKGTVYYAQDEHTDTGENDKSSQKSHVFKKESNNEIPLVIKQTQPQISGVLICADGAGDTQVKSNLISAISTLLGIKSHRIEVLERG